MMLVDSHCHFDLLDQSVPGNDSDSVIARAKALDVGYFLNVCVNLQDFPQVLATAKKHDCVSASVGIHPNEQSEDATSAQLVDLARDEKVVAIGETGLDYFRSEGNLDWQRDRFKVHIQAAKEVQKPLIIHTRNAASDTMAIMKAERANEIGGVMHCFSEDWSVAEEALALNFYISIPGIVTFKNAKVMQEVAKRVPLNRLLVETDSPYLAPVPHRGKPNEPGFVRHTAEYIAKLRDIEVAALAQATTDNFFNLFKGAQRNDV